MQSDCVLAKQKPRKDGYVTLCRRGADKVYDYAHRVAYIEKMGEIPEDMTIDHLCKTRNCINISHLEVVTRSENSKRRRVFREFCPTHLVKYNKRNRCQGCYNEYLRKYRFKLKLQGI